MKIEPISTSEVEGICVGTKITPLDISNLSSCPLIQLKNGTWVKPQITEDGVTEFVEVKENQTAASIAASTPTCDIYDVWEGDRACIEEFARAEEDETNEIVTYDEGEEDKTTQKQTQTQTQIQDEEIFDDGDDDEDSNDRKLPKCSDVEYGTTCDNSEDVTCMRNEARSSQTQMCEDNQIVEAAADKYSAEIELLAKICEDQDSLIREQDSYIKELQNQLADYEQGTYEKDQTAQLQPEVELECNYMDESCRGAYQ